MEDFWPLGMFPFLISLSILLWLIVKWVSCHQDFIYAPFLKYLVNLYFSHEIRDFICFLPTTDVFDLAHPSSLFLVCSGHMTRFLTADVFCNYDINIKIDFKFQQHSLSEYKIGRRNRTSIDLSSCFSFIKVIIHL